MIKLIASDLDGTLLPDGTQELNPAYFDLIKKMHENGILFASASGRQYNTQLDILEPVKDIISFICENGAYCLHQGKPFIERYFDADLANRIYMESRRFPNCGLACGCVGFTYVEDRGQEMTDIITRVLNTNIRVIDDLTKAEYLPFKIAMWFPEDNAGHAAIFREIFKEECKDKLKIITSGDHWIDFMYNGVNKGDALKALMKMLDIKPEETVSFGDQYNDVEMLQAAGTSYVVSTCAPGVEKFADHVTPNVLKTMTEIFENNH